MNYSVKKLSSYRNGLELNTNQQKINHKQRSKQNKSELHNFSSLCAKYN